MRFILYLCLLALAQESGFAFAPYHAPRISFGRSDNAANGTEPGKALVLTLSVDSIHHVNCLRATGYLSVKAEGGDPAYTYAWSNGLTGPVATSLAAGSYTITVTDDLGATATLDATIEQDLAPPAADAGADFMTQCSNSIASLNGSGSTGPEFTYLWTASNGGVIQSGANTLDPVISHVGTFTLKVTDTDNGCTASDAVTVGAAFTPPVAIVSGGIIKCSEPLVALSATFNPNNIIYEWHGPGGFSSGLPNPQVGIPGTYTFSLTDTITTCTGNVNALVTIDTSGPTAAISGGGTITCSLPAVKLNGSGTPVGVTFSWSGPNGFNSTLQNVTVDAPGTYILTVTKPVNGCTATSEIDVDADVTAPTASASVNETLSCVVNSVLLTGDGSPAGVTFSWAGPFGYSSNTQNTLAFTAGNYVLTVKNPQNGCTATASVTVNSNTTPPGATASGGIKTCANPLVTLNASSNTPGVSYHWSGSGGFNSFQQFPQVGQIGTYTVTVTDPVNGCISTATATVTQNLTPPTLLASGTTVTCTNPNPQIMAGSQTIGATFSWEGPNGFTANISNPQVTDEGIYTVTATNPINGCTSSLNVYVFENNTPPFVYAGDDRALNCIFTSILANPLGTSTGNNFTYQWTTWDGHISAGANTLYARFDTVGHYTLTVKNTQNGCTASDSMEVTQALPVTAVANQLTAVTCNGGNNGSAKVTPGGGNGVYSYVWSNGASTATAGNLAAGTYTVTVTDNDGCSATATATVTQPPAIQSPVTTTPQTMAGLNDGTATIAPFGGTAPYTVLWSTGATTLSISGLAPDTYTATITDSKGCTLVKIATVNAVSCSISGTVATTDVSCFGLSDGTAAVTVAGAGNQIVYLWSNGANTASISNLAAGAYSVTATGDNGCSITLPVQVAGPLPLELNVTNQIDVPCHDTPSGSATMDVTGGTPPYGFVWSTGGTGTSVSGLGAGTFTCTVTDAKGCTANKSVQILSTDNTPPQLVLKNAEVGLDANGQVVLTSSLFDNGSMDSCGIANWAIDPPSFDCAQMGVRTVTLTATDQNGNSATGTATVTITDNMAPVLTCPQNISVSACVTSVAYDLPLVVDNCSPGGTPVLESGLPSGSAFPAGATQQTFTMADSSGNTGTCSFTVTVTDVASLTVSTVAPTCAVACNGSATITATAGVAPYQYSWSNGLSSATATALCVGDYTVTVTDASGCSTIQTVTMVESTDPVLSVSSSTGPSSCTGACDGTILLGVSGANNPITVAWDNGQTGESLNDLCYGVYEATLTDAAGCTLVHTVVLLAQDAQAPVVTCPGNIATGFCNPVIDFALPQIDDNCPVDPQLLQLTAGLPSGSSFPVGTTVQTYRYTDPGGNTAQCSFTVTVHPQLNLAVDQVISASGNGSGSISISIVGGAAPYVYSWTRDGQAFATTEDLNNLFPGEYAVTVTDADGCTVASASLTVTDLVSAQEPVAALNWSLYPNPANDEVYMKINEMLGGELRLGIYDATGRLLREQQIPDAGAFPVRIDLSDLPEGWLVFRLSGEKDYRAKKLMKTR